MRSSAAARADAALSTLVAAVQYNCDVSDARHARDGALCTYLLGMRELYRWWAGAAPGVVPDRNAVGAFIAAREAAWDTLHESGASYRSLPIGAGVEAFDEAGTDAMLGRRRLVYGGGIGRFGAPVFFLAERLCEVELDGARVVYAGAELARGVVAPPAMSRGGRIVVRTDAMRRWLWTRAESPPHRAQAPGFAALIATYGDTAHDAIERIVTDQAETLALHEIGEQRAGSLLGGEWERMLIALDDRRAESLVRAVRDLLADCLVTLPVLAQRGTVPALHFWFANLEGLRRALAPRLAALWSPHAVINPDAILETCAAEQKRQHGTALELLDRWRSGGVRPVQQAVDALLAAVQGA
ncbi:MAG TPA: hypothetical protein VMG60_15850 [Burkholderiaceae bacterium]|nr:hypothetical protein [Burkholderiaceae bacterium]